MSSIIIWSLVLCSLNLSNQDQEWRKEREMDDILTTYEPMEVLTKYYPGGFAGVTKEGYPIWIEKLSVADQRGAKSISNYLH